MCAFTVFFTTFLVERRDRHAAFSAAHTALDPGLGLANTLLLLTGSLFVAAGLGAHRRGGSGAPSAFGLAALCGAAFVVDKVVEYTDLITSGHTPYSETFFATFFVFTGIHLLHVLIALVVLAVMARAAGRTPARPTDARMIASGAVYWHMVDLLWLVLFCLYYLMG
ncbi:cytochrome c oxidase subunit 3 family protein [Actinomycetospora sp. TBRC 11914]|nr:cytochrome c oxidase subunit 3 family protein [Actinomycetospora sp. TBRC 11914]